MSEMLRVSDADWSQVMASGEKPVELLLREDIAVYIKVRRDSEIVYRYYRMPLKKRSNLLRSCCPVVRGRAFGTRKGKLLRSLSRPIKGRKRRQLFLPYVGFSAQAAFVQIDDATLAEIAVSRSCHVSSFSRGGFLIPRPYEVTGQTRGGYSIKKPLRIEAGDLVRFEFDHALIVDKKELNWMLAGASPMDAPSPEQFAIQIDVNASDLYVTSADFEALKRNTRQSNDLVQYPFDHAERMPGIYWMFQAAYALNQKHLFGENEVLEWLYSRCSGDVFGGKRGRFAAKLVPRELDRAKGRKGGPRPFKVWDLKSWHENPQRFIFPFVSEGMTLALAVADWWVDRLEDDPNESRFVLARKLYEQNFDQTETDYLVRLITGVQLSKEEKGALNKWASKKDISSDCDSVDTDPGRDVLGVTAPAHTADEDPFP